MDNKPFSLSEDSRDIASCRLTVKGRINAFNAAILQESLERSLQGGCINIILNMRQVEYMSSAGIRVLLSTYKKSKELNGSFRIENPSENVRNVIGMTALDQMLLM